VGRIRDWIDLKAKKKKVLAHLTNMKNNTAWCGELEERLMMTTCGCCVLMDWSEVEDDASLPSESLKKKDI